MQRQEMQLYPFQVYTEFGQSANKFGKSENEFGHNAIEFSAFANEFGYGET